jgi:hypothetical protein
MSLVITSLYSTVLYTSWYVLAPSLANCKYYKDTYVNQISFFFPLLKDFTYCVCVVFRGGDKASTWNLEHVCQSFIYYSKVVG